MFKVHKKLISSNVPRTIRFTEELFNELNNVAINEDISFNQLILQCCEYALMEYEKENSDEN
ncbi:MULTISPECIES: hypothetical protein [Clostridium]|uniref:Toxin-antitoxin system HicB family antitoxin n=1 Tax=Clostridium cibarium TaxID=2762247 RepID=A0ABR8PR32_9CLOT|nr:MULTISPECIES: hypothetical protein [Clostridium]MBD7910631.1 hypothetical protein [Clostridium cibarium]